MSNAKHKQSPAQVLRRLMATLLAAMMLLTFVPAVSLPAFAAGEGEQLFVRIVHIDCGRKYFTVDELEKIIDYASESNYTHVELAFGNDGLRFLLNDMSLTVDGQDYTSETVTSAIQSGNAAFNSESNGATGVLTESDMDALIAYAKTKNIRIIPMFDAPGHMYAVVNAMQTLDIEFEWSNPTNSGSSPNHAINPESTTAVNFVKALQGKYIEYFAGKGCDYYNFAADECGFSSMDTEKYSAYIQFVNDMAAAVKSAGMTPMMFNDGVYHPSFSSVTDAPDTGIVVCYWDAGSGSKYAQADALNTKGYKIINTHNKWYYVIGVEGTGWYGYQWAQNNMEGKGEYASKSCMAIDGDDGSTTPIGCMNAIWCDTPKNDVTWSNVENHIKTLAKNNPEQFTEVPAIDGTPATVEIPITPDLTGVSVSIYGPEGSVATATVTAKDAANIENAEHVVSYEVTPKLNSESYTGNGKVTLPIPSGWTDTSRIRGYYIDNGKAVTVDGTANDGKYTFAVPHFSEMGLVYLSEDAPEEIKLEVGETKNISVSAGKYTGTAPDSDIATVKINTNTTVGTAESRDRVSMNSNGTYTGVLYCNDYYMTIDSNGNIGYTTDGTKATEFTVTRTSNNYTIKSANGYYLGVSGSYNSYTLTTSSSSTNWRYNTSNNGFYYSSSRYITFSNGSWSLNRTPNNYTALYKYTPAVTGETTYTMDVTGVSEGETTVKVGETKYKIIVTAPNKAETLGLTYGETKNLPSNSNAKITSGNEYITLNGNTVTAGQTDGAATVTFDELNANGKVIAHWTYNFTVSAIDWSAIEDLPLQTWITNNAIEVDNKATGSWIYATWISQYPNAWYKNISAQSAYGENGLALNEIFKDELQRYQYEAAYLINEQTGKTAQSLVVWQGVRHTSDNIQLMGGSDQSQSGDVFNYIRFYNNEWQASADRETWFDVSGTGSTASSTGCTEQLAVYFMFRTEITAEVTTDAADWGWPEGSSDYTGNVSSSKNYVLLDFAVKYESGVLAPGSFPVDGKTMGFHCAPNDNAVGNNGGYYYRNLYGFRATQNSNGYEVYMVTVTMTDDDASTTISNTSSYTYGGEEKVIWALDEETFNNSQLEAYQSISNNSSMNGVKYGGDPYISGIEVYNKHGALITYYVRLVEAPADSLTVNYYVQGETNPFHNYLISVKQGTTFDVNVALGDPEKGPLTNGTVENYQGKTETVTADLSTMPSIPAQYRYAIDYDCVAAVRSDDGKTLDIYYVFKTEKDFVVDFGLPLHINLTNIAEALGNRQTKITEITVVSTHPKTNEIIVDTDLKGFTYKLTEIMQQKDLLTVTVTGELYDNNGTKINEGEVKYTIGITPASTVYYEEGFITATGWDKDGSDTTSNQTTTELGKANGSPYGYDDAYNSNTGHSGGSAYKVTVGNTNQSATASFTFTGDKFDLISVTGKNTGSIFIQAKSTSAGGQTYTWFVDTYYGNTVDDTNKYIKYTWKKGTDGKWHVTGSEEIADLPADAKLGFTDNNDGTGVSYVLNVKAQDQGTLYQIPVISKEVAWGTYEVTVKAVYYSVFDHTGNGSYDFYIDGVRIYNTLQDSSVYAPDGENDPVFTEIRDILIDDENSLGAISDGQPGAVFIDGFGTTESLELYEAYGPNNEVYLKPGQAIAFMAGEGTYFIGAKSPDGGATMVINGAETQIDTATDMYYAVTPTVQGYIVVANNGTGILSLTTIKAVGGNAAAPAVYSVDANVVAYARAMVLDMIQPAPAFEPATLEAEWTTFKFFSYSTHTLTVRTSDDVEYITVGDREIRDFYYTVKLEGSGWNRKLVKYKVFTRVLGNDAELGDYTITAYNADGNASAPKTATLSGETWFDKFN